MVLSRKSAKEAMVGALKLASEAENEVVAVGYSFATVLIAIELIEMCGGPSRFLEKEIATKA